MDFGIIAFADVSERRRVTREAEFLSGITANMSEGVVLIRADDFTIAYANASYEAMLGYEPTELVGRAIGDLTDPEFVAADGLATICDAVRATGARRGEIQCLRKNGASVWCGVSVSAIDHPTFGAAWIAVSSDITARREAQDAQARLASIVQASRDAILAKTLDGIVTSWNPGAEALFGYSAEEMVGRPIDVLLPDEGREEEAYLRAQVAQGIQVEQFETVRIRKDGTAVAVSVTLSPLGDADGTISGIATICRDMTERNRAEAALLEREDQLAAARDVALEASRLKSDFLANMSHEIRTPMNAVIGLTGLLLDSPLSDEQHEYAEAVRSAGESLLEIINDILDFSKIEAGMLRLELMDFDLRTVIEEVVDLLGAEARDKGLEIAIEVDHDIPRRLRGDPGRLRQIVINLLGNAIKFTDRGSVGIRVRAIGTRPEATLVRFEVTDTGLGVSPEGQRKLFKGFEQVDSSASRRYGGTGLGLAICKQLVDLMGGTIGAQSTLGLGSTFWFVIELPAEDAPEAQAVPHPDLNGARVLVVAADGPTRTILGRELTSLKMTPALARSGAEALSLLRAAAALSEPFDIALVDASLPQVDGLTLARDVRGDPGLRSTRVVMLTSSQTAAGTGPAGAWSVAASLPTPMREGHLYDRLVRLMGDVVETPDGPVADPGVRSDVSGGGARVLVAEDNTVNQLVARRMLEKLGYRADVAANGAEAVDALIRIDYVAVLMDCQMPEMDGFEATREIRRHESRLRRTPVIAMTAAATERDRERCFEADMDDYVTKPVRLAELGVVLARWVPAASRRPGSPEVSTTGVAQ